MRRSDTLSVLIETSFENAWKFISDPRNLHLWTVDFALSQPKKVDDLYKVETPRGVIDLFVNSDKKKGTIDFYFGKGGRYSCSPSRLHSNGERVIYFFTQFEPEGASPGLFEKLVSNVREELQILKNQLESKEYECDNR